MYSRRRIVRYAAGALLGVVAIGVLLGWLWWLLSPTLNVRIEETDEKKVAYPLEEHPEQYLSSDLLFVLIALGIAVLACILMWRYLPRSVWAVLGGAVGVIAVCTLMRYTGEWVGEGEIQQTLGESTSGEQAEMRVTELRLTAFLILPAVIFAALYTVFAIADSANDLGGWRGLPDHTERAEDGTELSGVTARTANTHGEVSQSPHS